MTALQKIDCPRCGEEIKIEIQHWPVVILRKRRLNKKAIDMFLAERKMLRHPVYLSDIMNYFGCAPEQALKISKSRKVKK